MFGRLPFCKTEGARCFFPCRTGLDLSIGSDIRLLFFSFYMSLSVAGQGDRPYSIGLDIFCVIYNG
jgi:hypothetical protein